MHKNCQCMHFLYCHCIYFCLREKASFRMRALLTSLERASPESRDRFSRMLGVSCAAQTAALCIQKGITWNCNFRSNVMFNFSTDVTVLKYLAIRALRLQRHP